MASTAAPRTANASPSAGPSGTSKILFVVSSDAFMPRAHPEYGPAAASAASAAASAQSAASQTAQAAPSQGQAGRAQPSPAAAALQLGPEAENTQAGQAACAAACVCGTGDSQASQQSSMSHPSEKQSKYQSEKQQSNYPSQQQSNYPSQQQQSNYPPQQQQSNYPPQQSNYPPQQQQNYPTEKFTHSCDDQTRHTLAFWERARAADGPLYRAPPPTWFCTPYAAAPAPPGRAAPDGPAATTEAPPQTYAQAGGAAFAARHVATGANVWEIARVWTALRSAFPHAAIVFASPRGGAAAAEPCSYQRLREDSALLDEATRLGFDPAMMLGHTLPISWVNPEEFGAAVVFGCHGAMADLPAHPDVAAALLRIYEANKGTLAAIGHGVAALLNMPASRDSPARFFLDGRRVACFSAAEEARIAAQRSAAPPEARVLGTAYATGYGPAFFDALAEATRARAASRTAAPQKAGARMESPHSQQPMAHALPYVLEDEARRRGANVACAPPFESCVVAEGRVITAQNQESIAQFVECLAQAF